MQTERSLSELVKVRQRFVRSANVERDSDGEAVSGYIPTARGLDVVRRIVAGLSRASDGRAISITGPYGSGKSSLALFLDGLFAPMSHPARQAADSALSQVDGSLHDKVVAARAKMGVEKTGFIRAMVTAQREPVTETILRALQVGIARYTGSLASAKEVSKFEMLFNTDAEKMKVATLRSLLKQISSEAPVLLVIDEFGKSLEHVASQQIGTTDDLYVLQDIAEWSSGSNALPVVLVTLQHLAFEDYVTAASVSQRREWSKVLGRFTDIPYLETASQAQSLIGSVFEQSEGKAFRSKLESWADRTFEDVDASGLSSLIHVDIAECYPLHPITLTVLPELCSKYGQNERTLFSFLAGPDTLSVRSFLTEHRLSEDTDLPSVRLDRVYDFFLEAASTMVGASASASRWLEIETRIRDAQGLSAQSRRVLKTIGVLNLISAGGAIRASRRLVVSACMDSRTGEAIEEVEGLVRELEDAGLITYREFADEYRVWSGTDFDLKGAVELARRRLKDRPLAELLQQVRPPAPIVAARHSQQTGTLRIFERRYVDRHNSDITPLPASSPADGLALMCVDEDGALPPVQAGETDKPIIIGLPQFSREVVDAARELAAHVDVLDSAPDLASDWVARRELRERAALAAFALDTAIDRLFGPSSQLTRWLLLPKLTELRSAGALSAILSDLCDTRYPHTPEIRNEMLARRDLTSQGAKARRDLLDAMVEDGDKETLGLEGYGPERAMYEAVLRRSGIHASVRGTWRYRAPSDKDPLGFAPTWAAIERLFNSASKRQVSMAELFGRLMAPPLGLKEGPIPVIVTAALMAHADDVALYESGTFVNHLTADVVERLARNPDRFALKAYTVRGARAEVVETLAKRFGVDSHRSGKGRVRTVISVISPLFSVARRLTSYARRTSHAPDVVKAVRDALFEAREPDELLFRTLPSILDFPPINSHGPYDYEKAHQFASALKEVIDELSRLDDALLHHIEGRLAAAFDIQPSQVRRNLSVRSDGLRGRILEQQLKIFGNALQSDEKDREDWLGYVGMVVSGRPISGWTDYDRARFDQQVSQLAAAFLRVESLHHSQNSVPRDGFDPIRVGITLPDGTDRDRVVWSDTSSDPLISRALDEVISQVADQLGPQASEQLLAALARRVLVARQARENMADSPSAPERSESHA